MLHTLTEVQSIIERHCKIDPQMSRAFKVPGEDIKLLEVTSSTPTTNAVIPFTFKAHPGRPELKICLVSEEEFQKLLDGVLELPDGWGEIHTLIELEV